MDEKVVAKVIENTEMTVAHLKLQIEENLKMIPVLEQFIEEIQKGRLWG